MGKIIVFAYSGYITVRDLISAAKTFLVSILQCLWREFLSENKHLKKVLVDRLQSS